MLVHCEGTGISPSYILISLLDHSTLFDAGSQGTAQHKLTYRGGKRAMYINARLRVFSSFFDLGDILQILKYYKKRELESFI